jgi:hypothetical protein
MCGEGPHICKWPGPLCLKPISCVGPQLMSVGTELLLCAQVRTEGSDRYVTCASTYISLNILNTFQYSSLLCSMALTSEFLHGRSSLA